MSFKLAEGDWMSKLSMNRQMTASSFNEAVQGTAGGIASSAYGIWDENGTGFQHLGTAAAATVSGINAVGLSIGLGLAMKHGARSWAGDTARKLFGMKPAQYLDEVKNYRGLVAARPLGGGAPQLLKNSFGAASKAQEGAAARLAMSKGTEGVFRSTGAGGRFIKNSRMLHGWGGGLTMAAFFVVPMVAQTAFGVAGKLLDEAHTSYLQAQSHSYDTRDFNNRSMYEWNMNKQNQMMTNMIPYENNMMSMARIHHSR